MSVLQPAEMVLALASRRSQLALRQTELVVNSLRAKCDGVQFEVVPLDTLGDQHPERPLTEIGGRGLFTGTLDSAIRSQAVDLAVHSLKDLPIETDPDMIILPVLQREDPRDVLVSKNKRRLMVLPAGSVIGTSSHRRRAQLLAIRSDIVVRSIRGNVPTRIAKIETGEYDAVILAAAGLIRLGLRQEIAEWFSLEQIVPAPAQGCMAVTTRVDNDIVREILKQIADPQTVRCVQAERRLLAALGGGCSAPISAIAKIVNETGDVQLIARVSSLDGRRTITKSHTGQNSEQVAVELAEQMKLEGADLLLAQMQGPLAGKHVVVTRAGDQADSISKLLRGKGAVPIEIPLITFRQLVHREQASAMRSRLSEFDWIVFTSATAIKIFFELVNDATELNNARLACVGTKTAELLRTFYRKPDFVPDRFTGDDLAVKLPVVPHERVLLPGPVKTRQGFVNQLKSRKVIVETWTLYETQPAPLSELAQKQLRFGDVDAFTFASPSAVDSFCDQVTNHNSMFAGRVVACIGSTTAQRAKQRGIAVDVVPLEFTIESMVQSLAEHFTEPISIPVG